MRKLGVPKKVEPLMVPPKPKELDFIHKPIEVTKTNKRLSFLKQHRSSKGVEENVVHEGDKTKLKEINHVFRNCISALSNNKIGARNAFAVQIIDHLEDLVNLNDDARSEDSNDDLLEEGELDTRFSRASKAIEGATRVYGFRVEAIYDQAFNFMTNMNVPDDKIKDDMEDGVKGENEEEDDKKNIGDLTPRKLKKRKVDCTLGSSTLAKEADITLDGLQVSNISVDTFFLKVNSTYDHSSALYYLLPNLTLHDDLSLEFDGDIEVCESKKRFQREKFEKRLAAKLEALKNRKNAVSFLGKRKRPSSHTSKRFKKKKKSGRHKRKRSRRNLEEIQRENEQFEINYKKELYLDKEKLGVFFEEVCEGFEKMDICPEMSYFNKEIEKLKLKKLESKGSKLQEEGSAKKPGEDAELKEESHDEVKKEIEEEVDGDRKEDDEEEAEDAGPFEFKNDANHDMDMSQMNFHDDVIHDSINGDIRNQDLMNPTSVDPIISEEPGNAFTQSTSFNNNDFPMDELTIEHAMEESFSMDQGHHSMMNGLQFSQDLPSAHHSVNIHGMGLPDLLKSEHNKDLPFMNMGTLRNMNLHGHSMFIKSHSFFSPKKSMFSAVPDEDSLWNRSVLNFETRLNAIDVNASTDYQYYVSNRLMKDGKFRNLMDLSKNALKQKNFGGLTNYNAQKKTRVAFDISKIDFHNLYVEVNNNELSAYDMWKKEKRKYTSNVLVGIDQTSYIFEIKENCVLCINSLTDKELRFSKRSANENGEGEEDHGHFNVVMNDVKDDYLSHDINIKYVEKDAANYFDEHMEDIPEYTFQEEEVVDAAIDKFCNMEFDGVWQNENETSGLNRKTSMEKVKKELFENEQNAEGALNFETVSKFVDVAKIKKILCDIVIEPEKEEADDDSDNKKPEENQIVPYTEESKVTTFSNLINKTKAKLGGKEAENASIHMLFVCLLYTCNDQELILQKIPNENDFYVHYGLPSECHVDPDKSLKMIQDIKK